MQGTDHVASITSTALLESRSSPCCLLHHNGPTGALKTHSCCSHHRVHSCGDECTKHPAVSRVLLPHVRACMGVRSPMRKERFWAMRYQAVTPSKTPMVMEPMPS